MRITEVNLIDNRRITEDEFYVDTPFLEVAVDGELHLRTTGDVRVGREKHAFEWRDQFLSFTDPAIADMAIDEFEKFIGKVNARVPNMPPLVPLQVRWTEDTHDDIACMTHERYRRLLNKIPDQPWLVDVNEVAAQYHRIQFEPERKNPVCMMPGECTSMQVHSRRLYGVRFWACAGHMPALDERIEDAISVKTN